MSTISQVKTVLRGSAQSFPAAHWSLPDRITYLMMNFPYSCNYSCLKCCNLLQAQPTRASSEGSKVEKILHIVRRGAAEGARVLVLAGEGEPLLERGFRDVVEEACRIGMIPYIFTNGTMLNADHISLLASVRASLIISLDSLDRDRYRQLTGGGRLEQVRENIEQCRRAYTHLVEDMGTIRLVSLAINMVVTSLNVHEVEAVREFCGDDIAFVCNSPTRIGRAERNWELLYGEVPANPTVDTIVTRMAVEHGPLGSTPDGQRCAYLKHGLSVGPDGTILACAYCLETAGCYGSFSERNLHEANREVADTVEEFYRVHGHSRCILRHPQYPLFVSLLRDRVGAIPRP